MFLTSKCREDCNLGLCVQVALCICETNNFNLRTPAQFLLNFCTTSAHRSRLHYPLYFDARKIRQIRTEHDMPALCHGVCFPQPCSCAGRMFAAYRPRLDYYRIIDSFPQKSIRRNDSLSTEFHENLRSSSEQYHTLFQRAPYTKNWPHARFLF